MKKVFTNSEICHVFNEQSQNEGRTSNNSMFFYGNKIYSYGYHYLLAEFIDSNTIVINNKGYSNTTAKHISLIINATRDKKQFFTEQVDTERVYENISTRLNKLPRATKNKEIYISQIDHTLKKYFEFLEYTKKPIHENTGEHNKILDIKKQFYSNLDNLQETIKEQQRKAKEKAKKEIEQKLKDWKSLEINYFRNNTGKDYLRLNGENIETSQNVKIPINEAKRLLSLIEVKNIVGQRVDDRFVVRSFDNILRVGCHNIDINEINYIKNLIQ